MKRRTRSLIAALAVAPFVLAACSGGTADDTATAPYGTVDAGSTLPVDSEGRPFAVDKIGTFDEPWAMTFLPDGNALVTQRGGSLLLVDPDSGESLEVPGTPDVVHAGQGGLGDVALAPDFETSRVVYLSWVEAGEHGTSGAVVGRGTLSEGDSPTLDGLLVIWRQEPKVAGDGHFSHRMAFSPDGKYLFVSSGDRQKMTPAQDLGNTLGTVVRLNPDGTPAAGNPFADRGGASAAIWSYGHRNALGLAFDEDGNLWSTEMGPKGGDEVNLITEGANYGWPLASNGSHYDGTDIPDHTEGDGYEAPKVFWTPSVSPGSLMIYTGDMFGPWQGDAFAGALSGQALIRVDLEGTTATKADEWPMGERIREVEQGPDGSIYLLEDGSGANLLRLRPVPSTSASSEQPAE